MSCCKIISSALFLLRLIVLPSSGFWTFKLANLLGNNELLYNVNCRLMLRERESDVANERLSNVSPVMPCATEKTRLLNIRLCIHTTELKEPVMERHRDVCNASSQHEVPSK